MSQDILQVLLDRPQEVFKLFKAGNGEDESINFFNTMTKTLLDPLTKQFSVLDEIYVDGLDSTQVFGQSKMVLEGVGEDLMSTKIPELREKYQTEVSDASDESDEEDLEAESEGNESETFESKAEELEENESDEDEDSKTLNEEFEGSEEVSEPETQVPSEDEVEAEPIEPKKDVFGLNDGFFDIDEFNKQIVALENEDTNNNGEEIDFFGDLSDEEEKSEDEQMAYYDDFYDKPGVNGEVEVVEKEDKQEEGDEEEEQESKFDDAEYENAVGSAMLDLFDEEDEEEKAPKKQEQLSSFEKQQQQIQSEIAKLEAELVADKKWTMKGEVQSKDRPQDSLLDDSESTNLEFDRTAKPVPVITEELTETLEDLIRRRIKEDEFDDLPKRIVTDISKYHNKRAFELSEQKSSKSLAELYEDDYKGIDAQQDDLNEETKKQHDEITELFTSITHKLDSLSSAHFIPKPHQFKSIDIKVNDTAASISMEDAQPLHVSSESRLAPQEIYKIGDDKVSANGKFGRLEVQLKSGLSYSKDELSREDKQRLRRANKRKKSKHFNERKELQEQQNKENTGKPGNKRQKVGEVIDTLSKAKNVTVIGKKGQLTDVKGALKKDNGPQTSNNFKL